MLRRIFLPFIFIILALGSLIAGVFVALVHSTSIDLHKLDAPFVQSPTIVYDANGNEWARFWFDRREPLAWAAIPPVLVNAFVAAEDHEFFSHAGISWRGILRSSVVNALHRRVVLGGSTITQQLVKLVYAGSERTFRRKIKEQLLAVGLERRYTKQQIMQAYLNNVYFGHGIFGAAAAVGRFWAKPVEQLTVAQAATLAAIVKSPERLCPLKDPTAVLPRRNYIISMMHAMGMIDADTAELAKQEQVNLAPQSVNLAPHWLEYIRQWLETTFGREAVYGKGLRIYTTMNPELQKVAQESAQRCITQWRTAKHKNIDAGLVILDAQTGAIRAMVGGTSFYESQFNRAVYARRQIGSILKPVLYASALEQGCCMTDIEIDEPVTIQVNGKKWSPKNHDHRFHGPMTLARALSVSSNSISVKLLMKIGYKSLREKILACGLPLPAYDFPALSLGCIDASVLQAAAMMNVVAQEGVYCEPWSINAVNDAWGTRLYTACPQKQRVFDNSITAQVRQVMMLGLRRYCSVFRQGHIIQGQACGKTGTTNDSRTCWFVGATPSYTTAVYVGVDGNQSMGHNVYSTTTAFPIWLSIVQQLPDSKTWQLPAGVHIEHLDWITGEQDSNGVPIAVKDSQKFCNRVREF